MANSDPNQPDTPSSGTKSASSKSGKSTSSTSKSSTSKQQPKSTDKNQPKKRISRRQKDEQNTRILYGVLGAAAVLIALVLVGQAVNQYYLTPRKVLATVNGHEINREDYWKYRSNTLVNQISQYQQYASFFQGEQQQQYLAMAQQASAQLDEVWGSKETDPATLEAMIDDRLYIDGLESLGLSISDADVQNFIDERFANPESPIYTPTATPTLIPQRAEWATETAVSLAATTTAEAPASPAGGSPEAVASPGIADGSPVAPVAVEDGTPVPTGATPLAQSVASPESIGSPSGESGTPVAATPEAATPIPTQTPNQDEARQTATANFDTYSEQVFELTHMNHDDYVRLVAEPALARELVNAHFSEQVGQSAEQVHARHILVGTEELANKLYADLQADPDAFADLAKENSIDTGTAPNGGDLGWFTRGVMVEPFEQVAFELAPNEIGAPVQTQFGWHIIQSLGHEDDRALTDEQIQQTIQAESDRWLADQREAASISSVLEPSPTPSTQQFIPPASAPTVAPATPAPEATGGTDASPVASPESE